MADPKYVTEEECKEKMLGHYDFLEGIINNAENSLRSETRNAAIGIKAYIDRQDKEIKADIKQVDKKVDALDQKFNTMSQKVDTVTTELIAIKDILVKLVKNK